MKRSVDVLKQLALEALAGEINAMVPLLRQVMKQTRARIFRGDTRSEGKLVSVFEPSTEIIRKGKTSKPTEFGKMVKLQEAESQIVIAYEVYDRRPSDCDLLVGVIDIHRARLGHLPQPSPRMPHSLGQQRGSGESQRRQARLHSQSLHQKPRANVNRRSAGSERPNGAPDEGRISVAKRRHGSPLPLQGRGRNAALGRARRHRR